MVTLDIAGEEVFGLTQAPLSQLNPVAQATATFAHPPQLLPSSDSEITPPPALEVLSAQARIEYVLGEGKV